MPERRAPDTQSAAGSRPNDGKQRSAQAGGVNAGGRPPKFNEPSRPVTLTLPVSTLDGLQQIDADRARAIVKLTAAALRNDDMAHPMVEIVEMVADKGLLVIGPSRALRGIPFLHLVEVAPCRYLLALDTGNDFKTLELAIRDVLEELPADEARERELITQLLANIGRLRRSDRVRMAEILFVALDGKR